MVRLFVSLIVGEFYSCNELFRLFVSFFVMVIKRSLRNKHGDGNGNGKKARGLNKRKNNNFARASRSFVHFFAVFARPQREIS